MDETLSNQLTRILEVLVQPDRSTTETTHIPASDWLLRDYGATEAADAVIFGVPSDAGTHTHVGTSLGPMAIRQALRNFRTYSIELGIDLAEWIRAVDLGNVAIKEWRSYSEAFAGIDLIMHWAIGAGKLPIMLGGDHSITYQSVKSFAGAHDGPIGLVWIDNHYDAWDPYRDDPFHCGCPLRNLHVTLGSKLTGNAVHIGSRGFGNSSQSARNARELGIHIVTMDDVMDKGIQKIANDALEVVRRGTRAFYVSVDMDVTDVVYGPGTQSSRPGGLSGRELMRLVRLLGIGGAAAFDIVEVAPTVDASGVTGMLAAECLLESLGGLALRKSTAKVGLRAGHSTS